MDAARTTPSKLSELLGRGAHVGNVAAKTLSASRDAALEAAEGVTRDEGAETAADAIHAVRATGGILDVSELPVDDYDTLNVSESVAAVKELIEPSDVRTVLAFEEAHKNRHGVVSAAQTRLAAIAKEVIAVN